MTHIIFHSIILSTTIGCFFPANQTQLFVQAFSSYKSVHLRKLDLRSTGLRNDIVNIIPFLPNLQSLHLNCSPTRELCQVLRIKPTVLTELQLSIDDTSYIQTFAQLVMDDYLPNLTTITTLGPCCQEWVQTIAHLITTKQQPIEALYIDNNQFNRYSGGVISRIMTTILPNLKKLHLNRNALFSQGLLPILQSLPPKLEVLYLVNCGFSDDSSEHLAMLIRKGRLAHLIQLVLSDNRIHLPAQKTIMEAIVSDQLPRLEELQLSRTVKSPEAGQILTQGLQQNKLPVLQRLYITKTNFDPSTVSTIQDHMKRFNLMI